MDLSWIGHLTVYYRYLFRKQTMNKQDLKIEYYKGKGPGGQNKNKLETACRVTHIPSGIVVCEDGRKRGQNRKRALAEVKQKKKQHNVRPAEIKPSKRKRLCGLTTTGKV